MAGAGFYGRVIGTIMRSAYAHTHGDVRAAARYLRTVAGSSSSHVMYAHAAYRLERIARRTGK